MSIGNSLDTFCWLYSQHLPSKVLQRYSGGFLSETEVYLLECHLLGCPVCQLQLSDLGPRTPDKRENRELSPWTVIH